MDSESLEFSLSLDSEFLNNLEADQKPDAKDLKEDSGSLDIDLGDLEDVAGSASHVDEDSLGLSSSMDGLSELSGLDLSDADS